MIKGLYTAHTGMVNEMKRLDVLTNNLANADTNGYKNPLSSELDTADPSIYYDKNSGYYYGTYTGGDKITLHRARRLRDMFSSSESRVVYQINEADGTYGFLWAPEIHVIDGVIYIYTSTHEKDTKAHKHLIVLRAKSNDPMDGFELASHVRPELLAIDPTVYKDEKSGRIYLCASAVLDGMQKLILFEMKSPTEPLGDYSIIAEPTYPWERVYPYDGHWAPINEGAFFVKSNDRLFIVYSGNGCWSDDYVLGIIEFKGGDMMNPTCWEKCDTPLMVKGNGNVGPGHATFFYSPDGEELWICHHCLHESDPDFKPMDRHCHVQKVFFDETGFPHASHPVESGVGFKAPSGEL